MPSAATAPARTPLPGRRARLLVVLSPLAIILIGHVVAQVAASIDPGTAWIAVAIAYWAAMGAVVLLASRRSHRRSWVAPSTPRPWWVIPAAMLLGAFPIAGILALNLDLLAERPELVAPWLLFALVNAVAEEAYWRGTLADATAHWPAWAAAAWSTVLFVASHPLMWGVFSEGNRSPMLYASLALMGLAWFAMRRVTGSLRWPLVSHALVDVGNLSVFVFVNAYVPPMPH